jgi:lipopolysaccharide/colanic/teichoic acid biosynthesis glycosyltransferase
MYAKIIKPSLDFFMAISALSVSLPFLFLVTLLLVFVNRGKPFFIQIRPGKFGKLFHVVKFKTMNDNKDASDNLLPDSERLTAIGIFLRKTSIDELPQLLNVVKGDMSLVGPRPLLPEYLPLYSPSQFRRHVVRPGITGWAQINGRNTLSWEERFEMDLWYVDNISFKLDVKILFLTIHKAFKREGINSANVATMERFVGKSSEI